MKRAMLAGLLVLAACGGGDGGGSFDEEATLRELRVGFPGQSDEQLADEVDVWREACTQKLDRTAEVSLAMTLQSPDGRRILEAACPDRVAEIDD